MSRLRVFVSSTYYDLKHLRASLEDYIGSLGFEAVLSEKGNVAFDPSVPLDESCYRDVRSADMFVLLIGGRYGSSSSEEQRKPSREFHDRYESITRREYETAVASEIPIYVLIESKVHSEYQTYLRNKRKTSVAYAHVESINVFRLVEDILALSKNNPTCTFENFADIKAWLQQQWVGLFRELLQSRKELQQVRWDSYYREMVRRRPDQSGISSLAAQVEELSQIVLSFKRVFEPMVTKISPAEWLASANERDQKLEVEIRLNRLRRNKFVQDLIYAYDLKAEDLADLLTTATTYEDLASQLETLTKSEGYAKKFLEAVETFKDIEKYIVEARQILGLPAIGGIAGTCSGSGT